MDSGLALNHFDEDPGDIIGDCGFQSFGIVCRNELDIGDQWCKRCAVAFLPGEGQGAESAPVEGVFEGEDAGLLRGNSEAVGLDDLQGCFVRFSSAVREEDPGAFGGPAGFDDVEDLLREPDLGLCCEEVRHMAELAALFFNRRYDLRVTVSQRVHCDSAEQIEVALAFSIFEVCSFAFRQDEGGDAERVHQR